MPVVKEGVGVSKITWKRARHLPTVIEYREPMPNNKDYINGELTSYELIPSLEGAMIAIPGQDYVIRGTADELYPIKKRIFNKTYEATS